MLVSKRLVLTCAHVVALALFGNKQHMPTDRPKETVTIDFPIVAANEFRYGSVVCWFPMLPNGDGDIAVLEISSNCPTGAFPVYLVENTNAWGHTFRAFGCPQGYGSGVWVSGQIKGQQANGWLQVESSSAKAIDFGFSGGGVWNDQLNGVSGIVVRKMQETLNVAYIIPTNILVANCKALEACTPISLKSLGEIYKISVHDLQTQLTFYQPRLPLSREDDLFAIALILLMLKSFDEADQIISQLVYKNPMHAYAWYLRALVGLKGRRPWMLNYTEAMQVQSYALKAFHLDPTQSHFGLLLALIKEDFFQRKGFRVDHPDLVSCFQNALKGKLQKEELLAFSKLVPRTSSQTDALIHALVNE